ncbi:MAG TPA: hypothetical protein VG712_05600, partial [Gemmatimonadales bacterium]|nr:hypothetical protein [Gemmatimonadales bacterium]
IPETGPDARLVSELNAAITSFLKFAVEGGAPPAAAPVRAPAAPAPAPKSASSFDSFFEAEARKSVPTPAPAPAAAAPAPAPAPIAAAAPLAPFASGPMALKTPGGKATGGIAGAFDSYATLRRSIAAPKPSIDSFIAGTKAMRPAPAPSAPAPAPAPAPVAAPAAVPPRRISAPVAVPKVAAPVAPAPVAAPRPAAPVAAGADGIVDVKDLCYSGAGALARALEVRKELIEVLANPMKAGGRMRPLLDELLDLVELAQRS